MSDGAILKKKVSPQPRLRPPNVTICEISSRLCSGKYKLNQPSVPGHVSRSQSLLKKINPLCYSESWNRKQAFIPATSNMDLRKEQCFLAFILSSSYLEVLYM